MNNLKLNRRNWKKCLSTLNILAICQTENPYVLELAYFKKPKSKLNYHSKSSTDISVLKDKELIEAFNSQVLDWQNEGCFYLDIKDIVELELNPNQKDFFSNILFKVIGRQGVFHYDLNAYLELKDKDFKQQYQLLCKSEQLSNNTLQREFRCIIDTNGQPVFYHVSNIKRFYTAITIAPALAMSGVNLFGILDILSDKVGNDYENPLMIVRKIVD